MSFFVLVVFFTSVSLFAYGISCLCSGYMVKEFERYGLPQFRQWVGVLEICGASGLLVGLYIPLIGLLAASGLTLLLLCGFGVRVIIKDGILKSLPALSYSLINFYLAIVFLSLESKSLTQEITWNI